MLFHRVLSDEETTFLAIKLHFLLVKSDKFHQHELVKNFVICERVRMEDVMYYFHSSGLVEVTLHLRVSDRNCVIKASHESPSQHKKSNLELIVKLVKVGNLPR